MEGHPNIEFRHAIKGLIDQAQLAQMDAQTAQPPESIFIRLHAMEQWLNRAFDALGASVLQPPAPTNACPSCRGDVNACPEPPCQGCSI